MKKEMLISLWIAQGYVFPLDEHQCIEDAAEEYFLILLRRSFFQDVDRDEYDDIISCKMHDLLHDIAQEVAGREIHLAKCIPCDLDNKVRHLSYSHFASTLEGTTSFTSSRIRTCLQTNDFRESSSSDHVFVDALLCNCIYLRALDFSGRSVKTLPNTLGKLVHLRYLDLSGNDDLEVLPISITKLLNLETLRLVGCKKLRELPNDLSKLTNLRVLDTTECNSLSRMPRGVGKLNGLRKLPFFAVEGICNKDGVPQLADELEEIKALKNLKGKLHIQIGNGIPPNAKYVMGNSRKGGYLSQHLTIITVTFLERDFEDVRRADYDEALLEDLQPHSNLREFMLDGYCGGRMPNWAKDEKLTISLRNLVEVRLDSCPKLQHIGVIEKLPKLKIVRLKDLVELEYIENTTTSRNMSGGGSLEYEEPFFPSLEHVRFRNLPKLKGWWRDDIDNKNWQEYGLLSPTLRNLVTVDLKTCPKLQHIALIIGKLPKLKSLRLEELDELEYIQNTTMNWNRSGGGSLESEEPFFPSLEHVYLENLPKLKGWWRGDVDNKNWQEHGLLLPTLPNLVTVELYSCPKLQDIGLIIGKLPKLKSLELKDLVELEYIQNTTMSRNRSGGESLESLEAFFPSLEKVYFYNLPKVKGWWRDDIDSNTFEEDDLLLPMLPRVNVLKMHGCPKLAYMPLCNSVEELTIWDCDVYLRIMGSMESGNSKLKMVYTDKTGHLKLGMPLEALEFLNEMIIDRDDKVSNLSEVEEVFRFCLSSLRHLSIQKCSKLKSVCGALEHLTALERLELYDLPNLSLDDEDDAMPWRSLQHCLHYLQLAKLPKVVKLPKGMRYLTALQSLYIGNCSKLESVPEWMTELTSLKLLMILNCSDSLKERCRDSTGEDWPNIQHIRHITITAGND